MLADRTVPIVAPVAQKFSKYKLIHAPLCPDLDNTRLANSALCHLSHKSVGLSPPRFRAWNDFIISVYSLHCNSSLRLTQDALQIDVPEMHHLALLFGFVLSHSSFCHLLKTWLEIAWSSASEPFFGPERSISIIQRDENNEGRSFIIWIKSAIPSSKTE